MKKYISKFSNDGGFMGPTHAISALALFLLLTALLPSFIFNNVLGTTSVVVYLTAVIVIIGAALMPDFDAVRSTVISVMGVVGTLMSKAMRSTSTLIQSTIKGPYDKSGGDPHRGFWHTALSGILVGLGITALTAITASFDVFGKSVSVGMIITSFIVYLSIQLTLASLFRKVYKKHTNKNVIHKLVFSGVSLIIAIGIVVSLPEDVNYTWVGPIMTIGWLLHLVGDMFTVMGVPILFPFKHKGKRWWNYRFPFAIEAGGVIESAIITPIFILVAIYGIIKVFPMLG